MKIRILFILILALLIIPNISALTKEYNFNATYQGVNMWAWEKTNLDDAPPPNNSNPPASPDLNITASASLDSSDDNRDTVAVESDREAYHLFNSTWSNISASKITLINWTWEGGIDSGTAQIYFYLWNYTTSTWDACANSISSDTDGNGDLMRYCSTTENDYFKNNKTTFLVYGTNSASPKNMQIDYVKLEITYDSTVISTSSMPVNHYNSTSLTQSFECNSSSSDDQQLDSTTLYIYNSDGTLNATNTTIISGTTNSTTLSYTFTGDGDYLWNCLSNNSEGMTDFDDSNRTITIDTTAPVITLDFPQESQEYNYNTSIFINLTVSDAGVGTASCWYNIDSGTNVTLANCNNASFNTSDGTHNVTLFSNDTLGNEGSTTNEFTVSLTTPAINLDKPTNNEYLSSGTDIDFNFTATDTNGIDTCFLYGNWSGGWHLNETFTSVSSGVQKNTQKTISEGIYIWNIWCNDTTNTGKFSNTNFTFTIDETYPVVENISVSTTQGSQTITFSFNASDTNLNTCKYTIFNSSGDVDSATTENTSVSCNSAGNSETVSGYGTYNLTVYAIDLAGNEYSNTSEFTTEQLTTTVNQGTSSTTTITGKEELTNFTVTTLNFQKQMDIKLAKNSKKARQKSIYLTNTGFEPIEVVLVCDSSDLNNTERDIDICDYVKLENKTFLVNPNLEERIETTIKISTPEDLNYGDKYFFNVIAITPQGDKYSKLSVSAEVSFLSTLFYKWGELPSLSQSTVDGVEAKGIVYPIAIISLFLSFMVFISIFLIARKLKYPLTGFVFGVAGFVGMYFLITIIPTYF